MFLRGIRCFKPWTDFGVWDVEGNVRVCCWSRVTVGNINDGDIEEIWNGEGYQAIRNDMAHGIFACNPHCPVLHRKGFISPYFAYRSSIECYEREYLEPCYENARLNAEEIRQRKIVLASKPRYFEIHTDNKCNLRCSMCHLNKDNPATVSESFLRDLANYYPYMEGLGVWGGEPLFSPGSRDIIFNFDYKEFPQCAVSIVTNGTLLGKYISDLAKVRLDWIQISLDAATKETYRRIRVGGDWQKTIAGIKDLVQLRNEQGQWFPITIDMVIQPENYKEITGFIELGRLLGTRVTFGNLDTTTAWLFGQSDLLERVKEHMTQGIHTAIKYDMLSAAVSLSIILDLIC